MYTKAELFEKPLIGDLTALEVVPSEYAGLRYLATGIHDINPATQSFLIKGKISEGSPRQHQLRGDVLDISDAAGVTPTLKVQHALQHDNRVRLAGYSWQSGAEEKVVPLANLMEGLKLYCYALQFPDATHRQYDGRGDIAHAAVSVPSRTAKRERAEVILLSIPTSDAADWRDVATANRCCPENGWLSVYFPHADERRRRIFCEHEIAAYWLVAGQYAQNGNVVPARMSPFAYPAQEFVDFYQKLTRRTMVLDGNRKRLLNAKEQETLLVKFARDVCQGPAFSARGKLSERKLFI